MKTFTKIIAVIFCILFLTLKSFAAEQDQKQMINTLSLSADEKLSQSTKELTQLRDKIATEKIPLAQELSSSEEKLIQFRREYEKVTRQVDAGNLEINNTKTEMKARQDELTYISNLLDEYARTFETKINVGELQNYGKAIEKAKQVTENTPLSMAEKYSQQIDFTNISIKRLFDAIGGMRFSGVGVDLQGTVAEGQYVIVGPVTVFSDKTGATAGLAIAQSGSPNPLIRPLEKNLQAGIIALVEKGEGLLPLDPSRGGALKAMVQKASLSHIFKKGGPIMWPLLFAAILAIGTVIERIIFLLIEQRNRNPQQLENFLSAISQGDIESAIRNSKASKFFVVRALGYALTHKETSLASALLYAQELELKRFRRGIPILDTVITLAPLLGLLGTVTGMMGSFSLIGGDLGSPGAITGGIAEALIATAFGLGIAITSLIPFNYLNTKMEEARLEMESAATQIELLVHPQANGMEANEKINHLVKS